MRKRFEQQLSIGQTPISEVAIPSKSRDDLPPILRALQEIFTTSEYNEKVFSILESKICKDKKKTGRWGMDLWEIFVLSQVRLGLNIDYDRLHDLANYHSLLRQILGVAQEFGQRGKQYSYQNIADNVQLLDEPVLKELNEVIVDFGHGVFKKKEEVGLRLKSDTYVVETNVHFPTDINLLWDGGRKCLDLIAQLLEDQFFTGWRKLKSWKRELKKLMRQLGRTSVGGSKNKAARLDKQARDYVEKSRALSQKIAGFREQYQPASFATVVKMMELTYFHQMLDKHIDLVERRLVKGEKIPHEEKLFSLFEPYTEWINKGKQHPNVELGKKLLVTTDQFDLIVDWQIVEKQADVHLGLPMILRLLTKYKIESLSLDRGFWSKVLKELFEQWIPKVVMPKKGKKNKAEQEAESKPLFKKLRNQHSAIESNINELEHRGLNRCPDKGRRAFGRYVGLGITAYNLHKIGRHLQELERTARASENYRQVA